jgi:hypothetical protein
MKLLMVATGLSCSLWVSYLRFPFLKNSSLILRNHVQMDMDLLILKTNESQLSQKLLLCPSGVPPSVSLYWCSLSVGWLGDWKQNSPESDII